MMRRLRAVALVVALAACVCAHVSGQRRVTPVTQGSKNIIGKNENKQPGDSIDYSNVVSMTDEAGNTILVDTISGIEVPDTAQTTTGRVPKMINPLLFSASVGVDIWDPLMRAFGQKYGLIGFSAELNLHNRYIPVVEFGLGNASSTPSDQNFTYHVGITPWFRIGANYNFLYNSNPDYQFVAGLRLGWSHFNYQLRDVTINDPYWGESQTVNFPRQTSNVTYLHVVFGLKVKILGPVSMGWQVRLRTILHETAQSAGEPWYIPGYGARNGIFAGSFSIFYTLPLSRKAPELPPGLTDDDLAPGVPPDTPTEEPTDSFTPEGITPEGAPVEQPLEPDTPSPSPDENPNNQPEI